MANFLILHGTDSSPKSNWFMWLKGVLIGEGHKVWLPQLPNSNKPNTKTYNKFLLSNPEFDYDEQTIIIGHSSGAVEILSLLQHLPVHTKVRAAILVSAFKDDLQRSALAGLFAEPFDFDRIKEHCSDFIFVHSDNDPYCPTEHATYLAKQTDGKVVILEGQGHFNTEHDPQYKHFPEILGLIAKIL